MLKHEGIIIAFGKEVSKKIYNGKKIFKVKK